MHLRPSRFLALAVLSAALLPLPGCRPSPLYPEPIAGNPTDDAAVVGQMALSFLNRFSTSSISPQECLVDFTSNCAGTAAELSDITYNREHYQIVGARLGEPSVTFNAARTTANIRIACSWDSRVTKCESPGCRVGSFENVGGTCILSAVREPAGWKMCTSNFSGGGITPTMRNFFGVDSWGP